jgi:hypothetical protein
VTVFLIQAGFLLISLVILTQINVVNFRRKQPSLVELAAMAGD